MILVSSKSCGQCKMLERKMKARNIEYTKQYANEMMDFCREYNILQLPTLLVHDDIYIGLKECMRYLDKE